MAGGSLPSAAGVEVWFIDLRSRDHLTPKRFEWLDDDEIDRYNRLLKRDDARRFATAHVCLRAILASYLLAHPRTLCFEKTKWGRPLLRKGPNFSLSHSGDGALVAVSDAALVGIDLERRSGVPLEISPEDICSTAELKRLPSAMHLDSDFLLRLWVRKEAAAKALGFGLHQPLSDIAIPIGAEWRRAHLRIALRTAGRALVWNLSDLDVGAGFMASLVTDCPMGREVPKVRPFSVAHMAFADRLDAF
ncbi:MAG: 4'-phosphopantetheinyl transferase superfamily protein [Pseudolabrys sp.]